MGESVPSPARAESSSKRCDSNSTFHVPRSARHLCSWRLSAWLMLNFYSEVFSVVVSEPLTLMKYS